MSKGQLLFRAALGVSAMSALSLASCSDRPTEPSARPSVSSAPSLKRDPNKHPEKQRAALLTNVPVAGTVVGGGTFTGTMTATKITIDQVTRQLTMEGVLNGTATTATGVVEVVDQAFSAPMSLSKHAAGSTAQLVQPAAQAVCDILFLDLGPLHLDLLGLTLDLAEVILDLNAVSGGGNLLGNLLCALVGLLDITALIATISQLLDAINAILAGISNGIGGASFIAPGLMHAGPTFFST